MTKVIGGQKQSLWERQLKNRIFSFIESSKEWILIIKRKIAFIMEKLGRYHLNTVINLITNGKEFDLSVWLPIFSGMLYRKGKDICMLYPERKKKLNQPNHKETNKLKSREILQDNQPIYIIYFSITKDKEGWRILFSCFL